MLHNLLLIWSHLCLVHKTVWKNQSMFWTAMFGMVTIWGVFFSLNTTVSKIRPFVSSGPIIYKFGNENIETIGVNKLNEMLSHWEEALIFSELLVNFPATSYISSETKSKIKDASKNDPVRLFPGEHTIELQTGVTIKNLGATATTFTEVSIGLGQRIGGQKKLVAVRSGIKINWEISAGTVRTFTPPPLDLSAWPGDLLIGELTQYWINNNRFSNFDKNLLPLLISEWDSDQKFIWQQLHNNETPFFVYIEAKDIYGDVIKGVVDIWPALTPINKRKHHTEAVIESVAKLKESELIASNVALFVSGLSTLIVVFLTWKTWPKLRLKCTLWILAILVILVAAYAIGSIMEMTFTEGSFATVKPMFESPLRFIQALAFGIFSNTLIMLIAALFGWRKLDPLKLTFYSYLVYLFVDTATQFNFSPDLPANNFLFHCVFDWLGAIGVGFIIPRLVYRFGFSRSS